MKKPDRTYDRKDAVGTAILANHKYYVLVMLVKSNLHHNRLSDLRRGTSPSLTERRPRHKGKVSFENLGFLIGCYPEVASENGTNRHFRDEDLPRGEIVIW